MPTINETVLEFARQHKTINYISEQCKLTRTQVGNILIEFLAKSEPKKSANTPIPEFSSLAIIEEKKTGKNNREINVKYKGKEKTLEDLINELDIDKSVWEITNVVYNEWDGMRPHDNGTIKLHQIKISLRRIILQTNYEIPKPINIVLNVEERNVYRNKSSSIKTAVILPDMHIGFRRNNSNSELISTHDRKAMDVALQITRYIRPDRIVLLGDNLDLAQESKYPTGPEFYFTTQASAVELAWWLAQLRAIDSEMQIDYLEGNHGSRIDKLLMQNAVSAYGLKAADNLEGPPLLSIQNLIGLDSLNIKYYPNYPQGKVVLNDNLICIHGDVAKGESGATVSAVVKDTRVSVIQGHIHRYEVATKTLWGANDKAYMYTAASFGCLCKIEPSVVPGAKAYQNWQQGLGIVYYEEGGIQQFRQEFVPIIEGRAILQSEIFHASEEIDIIKAIEYDTSFKVH